MSKARHLEEGEIIEEKNEKNKGEPPEKKSKIDKESMISTKTGGAYIPPARLRMMQQQITDKSSEQYQRISWEALKKSINGLINKVNTSNISSIVRELFQENIVRGRGVLAQSILQAQNASPTFTKVYAALVAIINTRFPQNGELILRRLALQFRRSYKRNRKEVCLHSAQFIAHLMNQQVAHEIIGLQILTLLLENPTDDSVEVAIGFLKECGQKLLEVSPRGLAAVMERLRTILHEQELDKRVQYMIEVMFAIRKDGFKEHISVEEDLDLVEETDQFTHMLQLDDDGGGKGTENELNVFHMDPDFIQNEENYKQIKKDILDESSEGSSSGSGSSSDESSDEEPEEEKKQEIEDRTETNLVALRRTIYLAIQSSLDFEECAHKLLKMEFDVKDYKEICAMIIDCCSQLRTYEKFFGLLGARFCILKKEFMEHFEILFGEQYEIIHRLETSKLRNVAKFFAHLLHSDALPWTVLQNIVLSEDTTTSSSRIFIKILFQELVEYLGLSKLNQRLKDVTLAPFFEGLFPKDSPKNTRFAINFFTSIGLGGITDELREHLKMTALKMSEKMQAEQIASLNIDSSDESSSDSSEEDKKKRKKSKKKKKKSKTSKKKKKKQKEETFEYSDSEESDHVSDKAVKSMVSKPQPSTRNKDDHREDRSEESKKEKSKKKDQSSSEEETEKKRSLRERLLKISNTVPEKYAEKSSQKTKDKTQSRESSSDNTSSESESSSDDDSPTENEDKMHTRKKSKKAESSEESGESTDNGRDRMHQNRMKNTERDVRERRHKNERSNRKDSDSSEENVKSTKSKKSSANGKNERKNKTKSQKKYDSNSSDDEKTVYKHISKVKHSDDSGSSSEGDQNHKSSNGKKKRDDSTSSGEKKTYHEKREKREKNEKRYYGKNIKSGTRRSHSKSSEESEKEHLYESHKNSKSHKNLDRFNEKKPSTVQRRSSISSSDEKDRRSRKEYDRRDDRRQREYVDDRRTEKRRR
uniref:pre-mRNA-splicing factor CWC22 homolog n=1 Tax=Styela clava TaxID=7725 RepID=UPI00193A69F8|nr:pre-mRNA-splicing factor CWC22 homolog [Styela clava]